MAKMDKTWSGAFVCIFNRNFSKILLLARNWEKKKRQGKEWEGGGTWGNIGGSVEPGETPLQACIREAKEEIGINLDPNKLVPVYVKKTPAPEPKQYAIHFYAASIDHKTKIKLNDESYGCKWFSLEDLPDKTLDSKEDLLKWRDLAKSGHSTARN